MARVKETRIVVLVKDKLVNVDAVIPLLMEIKDRYPAYTVEFVFYSDQQKRLVEKNYHLWEALGIIRARISVLRGIPFVKKAWRLALFFLRCRGRRVVVIKFADLFPRHHFIMRCLKQVSATLEIQTYVCPLSMEGFSQVILHKAIARSRQKNPRPMGMDVKGQYDYFLTSLTKEQVENAYDAIVEESRFLPVGYVRKLPAWQRFVRYKAEEIKEKMPQRYFLYILTCFGKRNFYFNEPELVELIDESLYFLKKYQEQILTVFRPHAFSDIPRLEQILKSHHYTNYRIDYGHPMILSVNADFVFGNLYSMTMYDAYYLGCPLVEYSQYDPEVLEKSGGRSLGGQSDFFIQRDPERLKQVLNDLIRNPRRIVRDENYLRENYRDTDAAFFDFWADPWGREKRSPAQVSVPVGSA